MDGGARRENSPLFSYNESKQNRVVIMKNSTRIAPCIALNDLDGGPYIRKPLRFPKANLAQAPIKSEADGRRWTDNDTAALMCGLAAPIRMGGFATQFTRQDIELALLQAAEKNRYTVPTSTEKPGL